MLCGWACGWLDVTETVEHVHQNIQNDMRYKGDKEMAQLPAVR